MHNIVQQENHFTLACNNVLASHPGHAVPAGLPPSRDGVIHDVVGHQEEGLQLRKRTTILEGRHVAERMFCKSSAEAHMPLC